MFVQRLPSCEALHDCHTHVWLPDSRTISGFDGVDEHRSAPLQKTRGTVDDVSLGCVQTLSCTCKRRLLSTPSLSAHALGRKLVVHMSCGQLKSRRALPLFAIALHCCAVASLTRHQWHRATKCRQGHVLPFAEADKHEIGTEAVHERSSQGLRSDKHKADSLLQPLNFRVPRALMTSPLHQRCTTHQHSDGHWQHSNESTAQTPWHSPSSCTCRASSYLPQSSPTRTLSPYTLDHSVDFLIKEHHRCRGEIYSVTRMDTHSVDFTVQGRKPLRVALVQFGTSCDHTDARELYDTQNRLLYRRRQDRGCTVQLLDGATGATRITFRRKGFFPCFGMSTIFAWHGERNGEPHMEVNGDMMRVDYRFEVREVAGSRLMATVRRKGIEGDRPLRDWTSFVLRVEAGEDIALMVLFAIALVDEFRGDD